MASNNLPKAVLRSPSVSEGVEDSSVTSIRNIAKLHEFVRTNSSQAVQEMHQNRLKNLRKEGLEYLKATEWKYPSIDKYIG